MRNIAEIIEDDRNGKQLSQTERQVAIAYNQGKYDAVRELKFYNNSNVMKVLDKIKAEIEFEVDHRTYMLCAEDVFEIIDKYRESEE